MPQTPTLLLTRPRAQAERFAEAVRAQMEVRIVISPVLRIEPGGEVPDLSRYAAVILTSANAVAPPPTLTGMRAHCVGVRTAGAAAARGARVGQVFETAEALVTGLNSPGPLIHLRGEHARGDIAKRLSQRGIETNEAVIYRQSAQNPSAEAMALLATDAPVLLPLFSPRSARLVGRAVDPAAANIHVIALSRAVADAWKDATGGSAEICGKPTAEAMLGRIVAALRA